MTIRDLREQGICLQGWIRVDEWDLHMEKSQMISYSHNADGENINDAALDLEIKYIYTKDDDLVIEVVEEGGQYE